jgi:hypothetical protein
VNSFEYERLSGSTRANSVEYWTRANSVEYWSGRVVCHGQSDYEVDNEGPQVIELSHWRMPSSRPGRSSGVRLSPLRRGESLLPLAEVTDRLRISGQHYVGVKPIPVGRMICTAGWSPAVARPTLAQFADCEVNAASVRDARLVSTTSAHTRNRATYCSRNSRSGTRRLGADGPPCGTIKTRLAVGLSRWVMARNSAPPVSSIAARPQTIATG